MRTLLSAWIALFTVAVVLGGSEPTAPSGPIQPANPVPLKMSYQAQPASDGKVSLTFKFEPKSGYAVNLKPQPKLDIVRGQKSILPAQVVPSNATKNSEDTYYGTMAPVTVTVDRSKGLEARFTYFFCSKADGFCARKIDKVAIVLP